MGVSCNRDEPRVHTWSLSVKFWLTYLPLFFQNCAFLNHILQHFAPFRCFRNKRIDLTGLAL